VWHPALHGAQRIRRRDGEHGPDPGEATRGGARAVEHAQRERREGREHGGHLFGLDQLEAGAGSKWPIDTKVPNACIVAAIGWVDAVWNMGQGANTRSPSA
jgi:hypothetical protein